MDPLKSLECENQVLRGQIQELGNQLDESIKREITWLDARFQYMMNHLDLTNNKVDSFASKDIIHVSFMIEQEIGNKCQALEVLNDIGDSAQIDKEQFKQVILNQCHSIDNVAQKVIKKLNQQNLSYEKCCLLFRIAYMYDISSHFAPLDQLTKHKRKTLKAYQNAEEHSRDVETSNPFKLQFALWYAAFLFESMAMTKDAMLVAEEALFEAVDRQAYRGDAQGKEQLGAQRILHGIQELLKKM